MNTGCGGWRGLRADHVDGEENIQNAETADRAAEGGMQQDAHQGRKVTEKIVLFPNGGPREVKQDCAHNTEDNHQERAKHSIHN